LKVLVFGGWFGSGNIGDDAILMGVKNILENEFPNLHITALSLNPAQTEKTCKIKSVKLLSPRSLIKGINRKKYLKLFNDISVCFITGGTPFYNYGYISKFIHFLLPYINQKKVICFGIGAKPIENVKGKTLTRALLNLVNRISVRDVPSYSTIQSLTSKKLQLTGDSALFMPEISIKVQFDVNKNSVSICPRYLSTNYRSHYHEVLKNDEIYLIRKKLGFISDNLIDNGYDVNFLPFHINGLDNDLREIYKIYSYMEKSDKARIIIPRSPHEAQFLLEKTRMVIGLRLHSLILSASQGTPVISINYDRKIKGFMDYAGVTDCIFSINHDKDEILEKVSFLLNEKKHYHRKLLNSCEEMRKRIQTEVKGINKTLT
jgi:polysaccharide pyruvyl transferase WcaK-like protein